VLFLEAASAMTERVPDSMQDWSSDRRIALVLAVLRGGMSCQQAAYASGVPASVIEVWKEQFLARAEEALQHEITPNLPEGSIRDSGVWICSDVRGSIAPCLMMQAACGGTSSLPALARWADESKPPRFGGTGTEVSLLHGAARVGTAGSASLHLFVARIPDVALFERETSLNQWRFPAPIEGIVLLVDGRERRSQRRLSLGRRRLSSPQAEWVQAQRLPYVVGVMDPRPDGDDGPIRQRLGLAPGVPVVFGPGLKKTRPAVGPATAHLELEKLLLGLGELRFDEGFATRLLLILERAVVAAG
jgi:hypothetical protein